MIIVKQDANMKKKIMSLLMIPVFAGVLFACSEAKTDAKKLEGKWNIVEVKGEKILKEGLPQMEFPEDLPDDVWAEKVRQIEC